MSGVNYKEYLFPNEKGSFTGTLDGRRWSNKTRALHCFFTTDEGKKVCLPVYFETTYCPKEEGPSFRDVEDGSRWYCEYKMTKNGLTKWMIARSIEKIGENLVGEKEVIECAKKNIKEH